MMKRAVAVHNSSSVSELGSFVTSRPGILDANLGESFLSAPLSRRSLFGNFVPTIKVLASLFLSLAMSI